MSELKPCPFCGRTPKPQEISFGGHPFFIIRCCYVDVGRKWPREEAITAWNTRSDAAERGAEVTDGLRDPLCGFKFADAALHVLIYEIGQFGTIWNSLDLATQSEIKAAIANAIEEAALTHRPTLEEAGK